LAYFIQVNYNKNGIESEFWCLDCLINKGKWKVKINSIQLKHFLLSLYFTNLLAGYSDSKSVINKNKKSDMTIFIYLEVQSEIFIF
jgi:hypothetical protein